MGCTASDNVIVTVDPLPSANAGVDQTICTGSSATLTASGGGTYQWSGGPSTSTYIVSPTSTTTYTVTVTILGCTTSANVTVIVNPLPVANAGINQTICAGSSASLTASGGGTYQWSGSFHINIYYKSRFNYNLYCNSNKLRMHGIRQCHSHCKSITCCKCGSESNHMCKFIGNINSKWRWHLSMVRWSFHINIYCNPCLNYHLYCNGNPLRMHGLRQCHSYCKSFTCC